MGFGEGFGAFDGLLYEMRRIEKEKLIPRAGIESSIIPAWDIPIKEDSSQQPIHFINKKLKYFDYLVDFNFKYWNSVISQKDAL